MFETNFSALDWTIVVVYLAVTVAVGSYVNRHIHTAADYLVGGRASGTSLSIATLIGTELGLVTLMYNALEGFNRGFAFLVVPIIALSAVAILGATGLGISRLRELKLTTIPEYFERRYNRRVRVLAGIICAVAGILNMGLFPKMGAIFLTYSTGMNALAEDPTMIVNLVTSILIVLVVLYTVLGGMVAVIATDYLQFVVLSLGMGLGLVVCFNSPDLSWQQTLDAWRSRPDAEQFFNPVHGGGSFGWTYVVFQFVVAAAAAICWAPAASRALTTQDAATTRRSYLFASTGMFARVAIPVLWGVAAYAYFQSPAANGVPQEPAQQVAAAESANNAAAGTAESNPANLSEYFDEGRNAPHAMPLFLGKILPSGLLGILVAGLVAAFMSTHDSYLLAWSSVISQDVVGPLRGGLDSRQSIRLTRISVVLIGVFLLIFGIWKELPDSVWNYMAVTGTIYLSGAVTALLGGMYWRRASTTGALWAMAGGLVALLGLFTEQVQSKMAEVAPAELVEYWIHTPSLSLLPYGVAIVLFVAGSLIYPDPPAEDTEVG